MRTRFILHSRGRTLELGRRTTIIGILNITPDSFYDGGRYTDAESAVRHGMSLVEDGADIVDIGAQSTRPGSQPVGSHEELKRILPVLKALRKESDVWISIDTYRSDVATACLAEGADIINDVSSFRMDAAMPTVISNAKVPVICMHFHQSLHPMPAQPHYTNLFGEITDFFHQTLRWTDAAGIDGKQIILDPGIGFGKTLDHNIQIIRHLSFLKKFNCPVLVGPSRKSFIGKLTGLESKDRLEGTAAAVAVCLQQGAQIIRVHDVHFFRRFCDVMDALY